MKQSSIIRQRRRLLNPPKTSAQADDLTDTKTNNRLETERVKGKISKYNNNDESRRQGRKD
jgi:hypothetical protein